MRQPGFVPQAYLTTDQLKENAERTMAGYDDLPAIVRQAIAEALQYIPDTELAYQMYRSGASADQLVAIIRSAEMRAHIDGVKEQGVAPGQRRFKLSPGVRHFERQYKRQRLLQLRDHARNKPGD